MVYCRYYHTSDIGVEYRQTSSMMGRIVTVAYINPMGTTATVRTMAMAFEIVKRNMMRPEKNRNTAVWSGNCINPIACDILYFWAAMNKQDRTRSWSDVNSANV